MCRWLTNNWRAKRGLARMTNKFAVKKSDFLWRTQQDRVWTEIGRLLGTELPTTQTPHWFKTRATATKNILNSMPAEEMAALEEEIEKVQETGYSPAIQRKCVCILWQPFISLKLYLAL